MTAQSIVPVIVFPVLDARSDNNKTGSPFFDCRLYPSALNTLPRKSGIYPQSEQSIA